MNRESCLAADRNDPLAPFRDEFLLPDCVLYFDGNSLGPRPVGALERATTVVADEWGSGLIRSWNDADWFSLPSRLGDKMSHLIGGGDGETVVTDTTTLNIFKTLAAALGIAEKRDPARRVILSERDNFPTDLYITEGLIEFVDRGYELRLIDSPADLAGALGPEVAVVLLSHVNYRTGAMFDLAASTRDIHDAGALVIWDLAHSVGAVPVDLVGADADFAVGCTYKYLNGGPGAPAFLWVHARHHDDFRQPLSGWWGHARPFAMEPSYEPHAGIQRFLCGTQPVVSLSLVECGLDIALRADPVDVRRKSLELSDLFIALVEERCSRHPLTLITPRDPAARGSHVSFRHPEGYAVMQALIARGLIGDYREPEVLRFGITPLYLGHTDVWDAVEILRDVLDSEAWDSPAFRNRAAVT
ncbi:kynureninase [Mycetocola manganoxydans]|uniref:Kynureninase n=1 Tax=Mycetocola manganoxydans TaxID=699879 RepID=A0A3L6ZW30_9MICO|nr:kynureninase [Mycetocola manganoxydans]RLP71781.1 kynureninase [Mycetocola manganoxydans]GHD39559.1 kynureninase [Mycetocola manganoxydans]